MEKNVGSFDKILRYVVAIILTLFGYFNNLWWPYILAAIMIATASFGFCPLYRPLKINTEKTK